MGVITKIALRNMKRRKTRYILTTITLVISVALFGGVMIVSDSFGAMLLEGIDNQMGTADVLIKPANNTDGWFKPDEINSALEEIPHVDSIAYRITGFTVFSSSTDSGNQQYNSTRTLVFGLDHLSEDEKKLGGTPYILDSVSNKETFETLLEYNDTINGNRVIIITESLKIKLGMNFSAGDTVWLLPNEANPLIYNYSDTGTWLAYTVVAVVRDSGEARDFDSENPSEGFSSAGGPSLFASINNTHELVDGTENHNGEYNLVVVGVDDINRVASTVTKIEEKLEALNDGSDWKVVDLKTDSLDMINSTMNMIEVMFLMFGLISLILSIILIMNVFNIIKKEQEYETGMFQAIGASKSETFRLFLTQGIVMGFIGAVIGTICSYFFSYVIFTVTVDTLQNLTFAEGFIPSGFDIVLLPSTVILTFAVGLGSCVLASLYPSWKASRKPIIECLSPLEEKTKRMKGHYKKRAISYLIGVLIIVFGVWLLNSGSSEIGPPSDGMGGDYMSAFLGPTLVLLGIIWLLALMLKYLNRVFTILFLPYLRKTKLLTEKNILRHPKRTALTFSMIALTTSFLIGMSIMMGSMSEGVNTTVNNFMGADARIYTLNSPKSLESGFLNIPGVDNVMGVSHQNARIKIEDDWLGHGSLESEYNISIPLNIIDAEVMKEQNSKTSISSPKSMTLNEMMDELSMENTFIIGESFAEDYDVKIGDVLPVEFSLGVTFANLSAMYSMNYYNATEKTVIVDMTVIAIVESISGFSTMNLMGMGSIEKNYNIHVSWTTFEEIVSKNLLEGSTGTLFMQSFTLMDWFIWVEKGIKDEKVLEEILKQIEENRNLVLFSFTKSFMISNFRTILNLIVFITNGLLLFAIIIAMIGLALHSLLTTMSRRREIGMLRSIGLSKKGVIRSISGETIILSLLGVFAGIFAGFIQGTLMVNSIPAGGFLTVTWTIPWLTIVILVSATLITSIISSRYPAKWAANLNIIDAVRTR